ncbi:MAG: hypothetical protein HOH83_05085 [Deltaproteobacteria bacterium]|nr:hypothetical protein [Deltaproteobacteria bacterium]
MLNRIVSSEKNQIVTLKVVDELRHVDIKPAMHALEKGIFSSNSEKINLDLNNLQVISHDTQELLGLVIRHVRLQNIPITISGSSQIDPGILLSISEGRPQLLEQQEQEKVPFRIKPKYFSRFSKPFFSKRRKDYTNQDLIVETEEDQNKSNNQLKSGQNEKQEEAENTVQGVVNENYSRWLLLSWFLFFSFTSVAITLLFLLWPEYQSGKIYDILLSDNKSFLFVKSEVAQSYLMQTTPESSFIQAVKKENLAEVERFIDEGVDFELKDLNGYTPLMHAVKQQNTELVKLLAEYGANVDTSDGLEDTPLVWASSMKNEAIVKVLLGHGADPDKGNFTPLMWAAYYGNLTLVKIFLESRANLNSRTNEGWTALMWAAERGNLQVIWELLKRGASVNMQNNNGQTALMLAAGRGKIGSVGLLLNKGGDAFVVDFNKKTAADYARFKQRNEVLQILEKEFELQ